MFHNSQELSQSAGDYKTLTLTKNLSKKRGRACSKRRYNSLDSRILRDQLIVSYMQRELRKEMKSTSSPTDTSGEKVGGLADSVIALRESVRIAEGNLSSARSAKAGMDKFPPLR